MKKLITVLASSLLVSSCSLSKQNGHQASLTIKSASDLEWQMLNPARADKSPQAAALWGALKSQEATGFLAKFVDGFSSPPHIHNRTYRAVVIDGLIHNDDPQAKKMWMPKASFWTQPKGEVHITAAKGKHNIALVEIDQGPYLVQPKEEAYDNGERPINISASNIVWLSPTQNNASDKGVKIAYLWGKIAEQHSNGTFIKIPATQSICIESNSPTLRAVVITGEAQHHDAKSKKLTAGSYFKSTGQYPQQISAKGKDDLIIYIRTTGTYKITIK